MELSCPDPSLTSPARPRWSSDRISCSSGSIHLVVVAWIYSEFLEYRKNSFFNKVLSDINLVEMVNDIVKEEDRAILLEGGALQPASPNARSLSASSPIIRGVDIDLESDAGTLLVWAAVVLLEHHANPNAETDDGITPLLSSVAAGSLACLELLVQAGAKVTVSVGGATPLHIAADNGSLELVYCLLKAGADPDISDEDDLKPIMVAAARGNRGAVELLFPLTSKVDTISTWSTDGIVKYMQSETKKQQVANLRQRFFHFALGGLAEDWRGMVPAGFSFSSQQIWKVIKENKDLDRPSHKVMIATVRSEEIANEKYTAVVANEDWHRLEEAVQSGPISEFGKKLSLILGTCLSEEATYFDGVRTAKQKRLQEKLLQLEQPAFQSALGHIRPGILDKFKEQFDKALNAEEGFSAAANNCTTSFMSQFDEESAES